MNPGAELKVPITPRVFPDQTFIWLPFTGGISAFAVILPNPIRSLQGLNDDLGAPPVRGRHTMSAFLSLAGGSKLPQSEITLSEKKPQHDG